MWRQIFPLMAASAVEGVRRNAVGRHEKLPQKLSATRAAWGGKEKELELFKDDRDALTLTCAPQQSANQETILCGEGSQLVRSNHSTG